MTSISHFSAPTAVLRDPHKNKWRYFTTPQRIFTTQKMGEVVPLLRQVEAAVNATHQVAVGFLSYEAASAFDSTFPSKGTIGFPLLWFGLFKDVKDLDQLPDEAFPPLNLTWRPSVSTDAYQQAVKQIHDYIRRGDTYQVNYTYRNWTTCQSSAWEVFRAIATEANAPYAAFIDIGDWAICSASPELFFRLAGDRIESRPMKGTAARGLWWEDDQRQAKGLRASAKECAENVMIVDMVRNDLGRIATTGSVHVPSLLELERYPTVWQMTSTVAAETREPIDRLFTALFPPASITGAPKRRSMEIIDELEPTPRQIYTGAIGWLAPNRQAQFNVAIRTVLINQQNRDMEYGVGGGIVWDSSPAKEKAECLSKTRILTPQPHAFDLIETLLWMPESGYYLLEEHLTRLSYSAEYFGFAYKAEAVQQALQVCTRTLSPKPHKVRLVLQKTGQTHSTATPLPKQFQTFAPLPLAEKPIDSRNVFLYHKTTERQVYDAALQIQPGRSNILLFNEAGEVTETAIANVAFEIDGILYTPPTHCGLLPGTCRAHLLKQGILRERVIRVEEALQNPNMYLMNAVRGLQPTELVV
jgi:para-aminobenzoate synthetase/4-amino-4-deoxychorismate lyase